METSPHRRSKSYLNFYVAIIAMVVVFALGVFVGQGRFELKPAANPALQVGPESTLSFTRELQRAQVEAGKKKKIDFNLFWDVWRDIQSRHIAPQKTDVDLFYGAVDGMVRALKDPYSIFLPPVEANKFLGDIKGSFEGIGAEIGIRDNVLTVIAPMPSSPAEKAGIVAGDSIIAIDEQDTTDFTIEEAVDKIRGAKGTSVKLTIARNNFSDVKDVTVVRDTIEVPSIVWRTEGDYAYLQMYNFNEDSFDEFQKAVAEIVAKNPKGLIFDLRNNPGGFLEIAVGVSSEWLPDGTIVVRERDNKGKEQLFASEGSHRLLNMPTALLVNRGSASASEIVAGALQDHKKAAIVGEQSFGKGSVQELMPLPDGSVLKLTVAEWLTPNERKINENGIAPDLIVSPMAELKDGKVVDHGLAAAKQALGQVIAGTFKPAPVATTTNTNN